MKRDLARLADNLFDVLVIGGGIHGACIAWEGTLRGLSVALLEKKDFGHATSANSLKTIHGGLRYLQQADFKRMRESVRERRTLMRIAPHLVHPLPCLMPTYGHSWKGREVMTAALMLNDLISFDRNRSLDPQKHLPRGQVIPKRACLELVPNISQEGLTGGAIWHDAQVYNSERLALAFVISAVKAGAQAANYVEATGFLKEQDRVSGVEAIDLITGTQFEVQARTVVNTAGPWVDQVLGLFNGQNSRLGIRLAKAINLVISRPLFETYAVAVSSRSKHRDTGAVINKGSSMLFVSPWRGRSMVGTTYVAYNGDPNDYHATEEDIQRILKEINLAYPAAELKRDEVTYVHCGLVPITGFDPASGSVQRAKHYQLHNHQQEGLKGLISVVGVKYTTARDVAEKVVDQVFESWERSPPESKSADTPLHGGQIEQFETFLSLESKKMPCDLSDELIRHLLLNYGSAYPEVLQCFDLQVSAGQPLSDQLAILRAETIHAIRAEMAQKLTDVIFRRTDSGTAAHPGEETLRFCAEVMGIELGWTRARIEQEIQEVNSVFAWRNWQS